MLKRTISLILAIALIVGLFTTIVPTVHAVSEMTMSQEGVDFIKKEEGFCSKPYWDYAQWTVGYGSRCPDDKLEEYKENGISREAAEELLKIAIASFEAEVNKFIDKNNLTLTQNQFDALVSFSYNVGTSWLWKNGSLRQAILDGDYSSNLVRGFSLWCNAGGKMVTGLVKRRMREANMFLNGDYTTNRPASMAYVFYDANGGLVDYKIQGYVIAEEPSVHEVAVCDGYEFMGWYTEQFGGTKVTKLTRELAGTTLYAHWDTEEGVEIHPMDPVEVKVTADEVNLREGPGTNYNIVGQANTGDKLIIVRTCDGTGYTWGKFDGGWICLKYTNYDAVMSGEASDEDDFPKTDPTEPEETIPDETVPEETEPTPTEPEPSEPEETVPEETEHVHNYTTTVVEPTCLEDGYTVYNCECGDTYNDDVVNKLGHNWSDWVETQAPTTAEEGIEERACTRCSEKETRSIDKIPEETPPETQPETDPSEPPEETTPPIEEPTDPSEPDPTEPEEPEDPQPIATGTVKVSGYLRVRGGPSTNYAEVDKLFNGDKVSIFETKQNGTMTWGKIEKGWVCLSYIIVDEKSQEPDNKQDDQQEQEKEQPIKTGTVRVGDSLRVRSGPGTTYDTVGYLKNGTKVDIFETNEGGSMTWGRVGDDKWICLMYVSIDESNTTPEQPSDPEPEGPEDEVTPEEPKDEPQPSDPEPTIPPESESKDDINGTVNVSDSLRIRKNAGTQHDVVGYYYRNDKVKITELKLVGSTTWGKTDKGWISMEYVKLNIGGTVDADCLRIRSNAGTNYGVVGYIYDGAKVTITEIKLVGTVKWGKISRGWVSMDYIKQD